MPSHPISRRVNLATVKPSKPLADMTAEERAAFVRDMAGLAKHRLDVVDAAIAPEQSSD